MAIKNRTRNLCYFQVFTIIFSDVLSMEMKKWLKKESIQILSRELDVLQHVFLQILKKYKFLSYRLKLARKIPNDDYDRRMKFCRILMEKHNNQSSFQSILCFRMNQFSIQVELYILGRRKPTLIPGKSLTTSQKVKCLVRIIRFSNNWMSFH